jgi:hypothetical protein
VLAARPVPVCDLVGIQVVARRCFHAQCPPRYFPKPFFELVFCHWVYPMQLTDGISEALFRSDRAADELR